jgi:hypothetical protein
MKSIEIKKILKEILLTELFNTTEKVKWKSDGGLPPDYSTTFLGPNSQKYTIIMEPLEFMKLENEIYQYAGTVMSDDVFDQFFEEGYHIQFADEKGSFEVTGQGGKDTSKILSIVINAIINKIKREKIEYIFFSAKEESRKGLYKKIVPLIASKLGWSEANNGEFYFLSKNPLK